MAKDEIISNKVKYQANIWKEKEPQSTRDWHNRLYSICSLILELIGLIQYIRCNPWVH